MSGFCLFFLVKIQRKQFAFLVTRILIIRVHHSIRKKHQKGCTANMNAGIPILVSCLDDVLLAHIKSTAENEANAFIFVELMILSADHHHRLNDLSCRWNDHLHSGVIVVLEEPFKLVRTHCALLALIVL